ncbi:sushi, von Willebrand factor type A, EGF and pentraxin domain-containing protein 1-like [Patella vulgata]|uniref:sushi, von Willebrand factor type A, EGF and pentraxin domain-containing protein 1-like n=1 Tax=Patella vulgata TaxID=6465 RepID=UPI0024A81AA6|nr:sushi, von Willebrand factor type A, EGF and pentraxin domain-containing protein 1-like [Patella vulgata]
MQTPTTTSTQAGIGSFTYTCKSFYVLDGAAGQGGTTVTCLANGRWDFGTLRCLPQTCPDLGVPLGGVRDSIAYSINDQAKFSCLRSGFQLSTTSAIACLQNGASVQWNETLPTCQDVTSPMFTNCPQTPISITKYGRVSYTIPSATDNSNSLSDLTVNPAYFRPDIPVPDSIKVTYTATDHSGQQALCSINIEVKDEIAPTVQCPASRTIVIENAAQATTVTWTDNDLVILNDNVGVTSTIFSPSSLALSLSDVGSVNSVIARVQDAAGNMASCRFQVTVVGICQPDYLGKSINGIKNCMLKGNGNGYTCAISCKQGYYFKNEYPGEVFTTECDFGGNWTQGEIPHCAGKF